MLDGEALYTNNDETDADDVLMGKAIGGLSNPEIRWENTVSANVGLDAKLFNDELSLSLDVFSKKTNDLLVQANVSGSWAQQHLDYSTYNQCRDVLNEDLKR